MADDRSTDVTMSDSILTEMQRITRTAAEPWASGDSVKLGIRRASRTLGISYRRAKAFWYGEDCSVLAREADRLRIEELHLITAKRERLERELQEITARLNARGRWGNGEGVGTLAGSVSTGAAPENNSARGGQVLSAENRGVDEARQVVGGEVSGRIEDARQGRLLG